MAVAVRKHLLTWGQTERNNRRMLSRQSWLFCLLFQDKTIFLSRRKVNTALLITVHSRPQLKIVCINSSSWELLVSCSLIIRSSFSAQWSKYSLYFTTNNQLQVILPSHWCPVIVGGHLHLNHGLFFFGYFAQLTNSGKQHNCLQATRQNIEAS